MGKSGKRAESMSMSVSMFPSNKDCALLADFPVLEIRSINSMSKLTQAASGSISTAKKKKLKITN